MKNFFWIFGIIFFIMTTIIVMNEKDSAKIKRVVITNENFIVRNSSAKIDSKSNNSKLQNPEISYETETKYNNTPTTEYENENFANINHEVEDIWVKNHTPNEHVQHEKQYTSEYQQQEIENDRFYYRDIDWNTWKSNFVNQILEDSMSIESLDYYGVGSGFYYSFTVTNTGEIRDINVASMQLTNEDKNKIKRLIKSYAHKNITKFPKNSDRKTAKVSAIMLLGEQEKKADPSDFNDNERIKIKY